MKTPRTLPQFREWTVDLRLKEFRKITKTGIKFVRFASSKGESVLRAYMKSLPKEEAIKVAVQIA